MAPRVRQHVVAEGKSRIPAGISRRTTASVAWQRRGTDPGAGQKFNARAVYFNRCVEPWRAAQDQVIKEFLQSTDVAVHTSNGSYLFDPAVVAKPDGTPYRVFTPYYRKGCLERGRPPRTPRG